MVCKVALGLLSSASPHPLGCSPLNALHSLWGQGFRWGRPEAVLVSLELPPLSFHRIFMEIPLLVWSFIDNISDPEHGTQGKSYAFFVQMRKLGHREAKKLVQVQRAVRLVFQINFT